MSTLLHPRMKDIVLYFRSITKKKGLSDRLSVKIKTSEGEIVSITVEDREPERAAEIANAFVRELDEFNRNLVMTSGGRMRVFLEKRLKETEEKLKKAEEAVKAFQEVNGAVNLSVQSSSIIGMIRKLNGQMIEKEVALQTFLSFSTRFHPQVEILEAELRELKREISVLEEGENREGGLRGKSSFIPTTRFPDLDLQYARLLREQTTQQELYRLLIEQYEMARIKEATNTPTIHVLGVANVPEESIRPKRMRIVLIYTFAAAFFGAIFVFFLEYLEYREKASFQVLHEKEH